MGTSLTGLTPATTYDALIKVGDNGPITASLKTLSDGLGNNLPMEASTSTINFTGTLQQSGTAVPTAAQVNAKQDTLVSGTNIKTINGTSILGSGNIVTPSTPPSGVAGAIQFTNGSAFASDAANLFWDDTNNRLGIGTNTPDTTATFKGGVSGSVGTRIATFEGNLPEILFKDTNNNTGFAIAKYGQIVYFVNTNASGGYSSYSGLTNAQGQWSFGGGFNPSGTVHVKGSGSTSATSSLIVENNAGTTALEVLDDSRVKLGNSADFTVYSGSAVVSRFPMNVGSTSLPTSSAILQVDSTTKGFLPPRMTTTQKNNISSPAAGLVVYDSTTNKLCCYDGSTWNDLF